MSLPSDPTESAKKQPFWHSLASPRREQQQLPNRFLALAPNSLLLNRTSSKQRSESRSKQRSTSRSKGRETSRSRTRGFRRGDPVIEQQQSPLGISATNYSVPEDYKGAPSRLLVTNTEQEVIFFNDENGPSSLFDEAWDTTSDDDSIEDTTTSSNCSIEVPPPPVGFPLAPQKSIDDFNNERSNIPANSSSFTITTSSEQMTPSTKKSGLALFGRNKSDAKRKAKEIVENARDKERSFQQSALLTPLKENHHSAVTIFLLLLETDTKMFELIQLRYPRKNTTVADLLKMIPKNATEKALAKQSYVGITRPHRRATPVYNVNLLASNSVSTVEPSANIFNGEIILAIPANSESRKIVSLSKQILANAHIRKLMEKQDISKSGTSKKSAVSKKSSSKDKFESPSPSHTDVLAALSHSNIDSPTALPNYTISSFEGQSAPSGIESKQSSDSSNKSESSTTPLLEAVLPLPLVTSAAKPTLEEDCFVNKKIVCKGGADRQTATDGLQHVVEATEQQQQRSPMGVDEECTDTAQEIDFPTSGDMLDAFLSKEDVMKVCRTRRPNDESNIFDNLSCGGDSAGSSLTTTNSLRSWTQQQTMDSSLASKYAAIHLEEEIAALHRQSLQRKRRFARQIKILKRCAVVLWMASVARYYMDPNGHAAASTRENILEEPLGLLGFFQFLLCFVSCLKIQRFFQKPVVPISQSRCPALQLVSQLSENRVAATSMDAQKEVVAVGNRS